MKELFTIGHSNHSLDHFLELLLAHQVLAIADVRSSPYSKYASQFNKEVLEKALRGANIEYLFLSRELGARRSEDSCYIDGQARFDRIAQLAAFRRGLERVLEVIEHYRVALMCSESDPITCHRTILVCRELKRIRPELEITHILGDGTAERQELSEERLVKLYKLKPELFGDLTSRSGLIEKAYDLQAEKIACKKAPAEA
ncbi:MAG: hypothetical protein AMJ79_05185 [Phycisphaerae bacterium SM23_30]|nr:MAG: hypothetical protein AMJ79_05185 [Phycisphaerae bacterium SM23_30]